jgi:hypothetical protein
MLLCYFSRGFGRKINQIWIRCEVCHTGRFLYSPSVPGTLAIEIMPLDTSMEHSNGASWQGSTRHPKRDSVQKCFSVMGRHRASSCKEWGVSSTQNFYQQPITMCMIINVCNRACSPSALELIGTTGTPASVRKHDLWFLSRCSGA